MAQTEEDTPFLVQKVNTKKKKDQAILDVQELVIHGKITDVKKAKVLRVIVVRLEQDLVQEDLVNNFK